MLKLRKTSRVRARWTTKEHISMTSIMPGILAIVVALGGCERAPFDTADGEGYVRMTVNGLPAGTTDAGTTLIVSEKGGSVELSLSDPVTVDTVPVGAYEVVYTPPQAYVVADGWSGELSVVITRDTTTDVEMAVVPATGTLRITVSGIDGTGGRGSALIQRTDISGQSSVTVNIPSNGTADSSVPVGAYEVTYTPPSGYEMVDGSPDTRTTTISHNEHASVAFQVQEVLEPPPSPPPPPSAGVVFRADWSTATGQSAEALTDGGRWEHQIGNGRRNEVVSAGGLDFPTSNVLAGWWEEGSRYGIAPTQLVRTASIPVPGVGQSLYYRWYIRVVAPDGLDADDQTHPIQDGNAAGDSNWMFEVVTRSTNGSNGVPAGHWSPRFNYQANLGTHGHYKFYHYLETDQTYRFEMRLHRTASSAFAVEIRVYDSADNLVADNSDFVSTRDHNTVLSQVASHSFVNANNLNGLNAGHNGLVMNLSRHTLAYYQGGFCVRTDRWCGAYDGGT